MVEQIFYLRAKAASAIYKLGSSLNNAPLPFLHKEAVVHATEQRRVYAEYTEKGIVGCIIAYSSEIFVPTPSYRDIYRTNIESSQTDSLFEEYIKALMSDYKKPSLLVQSIIKPDEYEQRMVFHRLFNKITKEAKRGDFRQLIYIAHKNPSLKFLLRKCGFTATHIQKDLYVLRWLL